MKNRRELLAVIFLFLGVAPWVTFAFLRLKYFLFICVLLLILYFFLYAMTCEARTKGWSLEREGKWTVTIIFSALTSTGASMLEMARWQGDVEPWMFLFVAFPLLAIPWSRRMIRRRYHGD